LDGKPNREIACLLSRSKRTVEVHRSHVMRKLGVRTRVDLVKRTLELDLNKP
jgi:DNA-binding NarL/FixJ family response regulator